MTKVTLPSSDMLLDVYPFLFAMEGGGKELVDVEIRRSLETKGACKVLEVGLFLGYSAKRWLALDNRVRLVGVDIFERNENVFSYYIFQNIIWATRQFQAIDTQKFLASYALNGQFLTFCRNLEGYIEKMSIYKGNFNSLGDLIESEHPDIDVIFLDADKSRALLDLCQAKFPGAVLCGDDWTWAGPNKDFPMRMAVNGFCVDNGFTVVSSGATWKIVPPQ